MKKSKVGLYFLLAVIAFIAYGLLKPSTSTDNSGKLNLNSNQSSGVTTETNQNVNSADLPTQTNNPPAQAPVVTANTIEYLSKDSSWSIKYPKELLLKHDEADFASFQSGSITLSVSRASQVTANFKGYTNPSSSKITVGGEKADKTLEESRDHVAGYPSSKIVIVNFNHSGKPYQITYEFGYNGPDSDKNLTTFDNILSSFTFN